MNRRCLNAAIIIIIIIIIIWPKFQAIFGKWKLEPQIRD